MPTEIRLPADGSSDDEAINNGREDNDNGGRLLAAASAAVDDCINDNSQHEPFTPSSHNKASSSNALVIHSPSEDSRDSQQLRQQRNRWGWGSDISVVDGSNNSIGISDNLSTTTNFRNVINVNHYLTANGTSTRCHNKQDNDSDIPHFVDIKQKHHPLNNTQVTKQINRYNNNKASGIKKRDKRENKDDSDVWLDETQQLLNNAKKRRLGTIQVGNAIHNIEEWINQLQNKRNNAKGRGLGLSLVGISDINQDFNEGFSSFNDEDSTEGVFGSVASYNGGAADLFITHGGALLDDTSTQSNSNNSGNHDMDMDNSIGGGSSSDISIRDDKDISDGGDVSTTASDERAVVLVDGEDNATYEADMFDAVMMVAKTLDSGMVYTYGQQNGSGDCVNRGGGIISPVPNSDGDSVEWGTLRGVGIDGMGSSDDEDSIMSDDEERPLPRRRKASVDEDDDIEWIDISKSPQQQQQPQVEEVQSFEHQEDDLLTKYSTSNQIQSHELYEAAPKEVMPKYLAERATSNRSICNCCYSSITQGSVRVGLLDEASGVYGNFFHLKCWPIPEEVLDDTVELGVADDVLPLTSEEGDDGMSVEEEQATAAASDPLPPSAKEKTPVPLRRSKRRCDKDSASSKATQRSKRKEAEVSVPLPSQPRPTRSRSGKGGAASTAVQQPSGSRALSFKKKTSFTGKALLVTGRPVKLRDRGIVQGIAKKMGSTLAKGKSGKVNILIVLKKPGKGTRDKCTNATEHSEDYFIESACRAVTNFPPGSTADEQLDLLIQDVSTQPSSLSTQPSSSLTGQITKRKTTKYLRSGQVWNQCTNAGVDLSLKGDDMNQPGSSWANQARSCCVVNFTLTSEEEERGCLLNHEGQFPPMKFERLPLPTTTSILSMPICIIKGCFQQVRSKRGDTCLNGCCPAHTQQYGKKGPPAIMKRSKTYKRKDLQIEQSIVTTAHGIRQVSTRQRLSDGEPWSEEVKYYNIHRSNDNYLHGTELCIKHGNRAWTCTLGCQPCEHGENDPRNKCTDCYPALKCRTDKCDSIKSKTANDDTEGLCAYCINDMTGNSKIEQLNHNHLRRLGHHLRTGRKHPILSYKIDGTMEGEGHFDELNWENDEGTLKEGHNSLRHYPTNAHYQRMEDIHDAKSDLSKGSVWLRMNSANRRSLDMTQKVQNHISASRLDFYKTATAEDAGADNVIEFHNYSLDSRHVQHSLNMWWNNGKKDGTFHVRVFEQVSDLDVDADDLDVEEAFVEIKYKRGKYGVWVEK